jgi:hypothetical protein
MRVKIEYGCRVRETDVERTEVVETDNFFQLYCKLKKEFLAPYAAEEALIEGTPNCTAEDYLNEFSEIDEEEEMTFYIGFEEGEYIEGWKLI